MKSTKGRAHQSPPPSGRHHIREEDRAAWVRCTPPPLLPTFWTLRFLPPSLEVVLRMEWERDACNLIVVSVNSKPILFKLWARPYRSQCWLAARPAGIHSVFGLEHWEKTRATNHLKRLQHWDCPSAWGTHWPTRPAELLLPGLCTSHLIQGPTLEGALLSPTTRQLLETHEADF